VDTAAVHSQEAAAANDMLQQQQKTQQEQQQQPQAQHTYDHGGYPGAAPPLVALFPWSCCHDVLQNPDATAATHAGWQHGSQPAAAGVPDVHQDVHPDILAARHAFTQPPPQQRHHKPDAAGFIY
jgi:hypothetical protein